MTQLTKQQQLFVDDLVGSGATATEAARRAGYAHPKQEAYRLTRNQHVMDAVREAQNRLIAGAGTNVALKTLLRVMEDPKAPASAQVSAARTWLDAAGRFQNAGAGGDRDKPIHEMTPEELRAFISRMDKIIEGEMIDVTPGSAPLIRLAGAAN